MKTTPYITLTDSAYPDQTVAIADRTVIAPHSGLDRVVSLLESLAYTGWKESTPVSLTVAMADGRSLTVAAGPAFLGDLAEQVASAAVLAAAGAPTLPFAWLASPGLTH